MNNGYNSNYAWTPPQIHLTIQGREPALQPLDLLPRKKEFIKTTRMRSASNAVVAQAQQHIRPHTISQMSNSIKNKAKKFRGAR
jgi:hypothetical protein